MSPAGEGPARLVSPERDGRSSTVIRAPNHLGDVVMALPALAEAGADVMVVRGLAPILEMADLPGAVIPLDRGLRGFLAAVGTLRRRGYGRGSLLSASFSAAWLLRWGGVGRLRGTATDGRTVLLSDAIDPAELRGMHRVDAFRVLLGLRPSGEPRPHRLRAPSLRMEEWRGVIGAGSSGGRPLVALLPGSNAPARRWPADRFGSLGRALATDSTVIVLGGPAERALTARVAAAVPGAVDLGGRTDLFDLAAVLAISDVAVTNDSGPMHLAGALRTPTVSLWGSSDPAEVRQLGAPDARVEGPTLPCRPCRRNECERRGAGTLLPDAHEECMRTIETDAVLSAVRASLTGSGPCRTGAAP